MITGDNSAAGNYFQLLKTAQETLIDPTKRFAYERFGPEILTWQNCSSIRDYLMVGIQAMIPLYAGSIIFLVILGVLGYLQQGRFVRQSIPVAHRQARPPIVASLKTLRCSRLRTLQWRYFTILSLFILEYHSLTRPYPSPFLSKLINPILALTRHPALLPFQLLILARKVAFTVFIAASQLAPLFQSQELVSPSTSGVPSVDESRQLMLLEQLASTSEAEVSRLLALDMTPFLGDEAGLKELSGKMKDWLVTNTIRSDVEVRDAINRAFAARKNEEVL